METKLSREIFINLLPDISCRNRNSFQQRSSQERVNCLQFVCFPSLKLRFTQQRQVGQMVQRAFDSQILEYSLLATVHESVHLRILANDGNKWSFKLCK